jgi:hypothetical protein
MIARKEYLGDAVYVDYDGFYLILTTEDGIQATNTIMLEPEVVSALVKYQARLTADLLKRKENNRVES